MITPWRRKAAGVSMYVRIGRLPYPGSGTQTMSKNRSGSSHHGGTGWSCVIAMCSAAAAKSASQFVRVSRGGLQGGFLPLAAGLVEPARQVGDQHAVPLEVVAAVLDAVNVFPDVPVWFARLLPVQRSGAGIAADLGPVRSHHASMPQYCSAAYGRSPRPPCLIRALPPRRG